METKKIATQRIVAMGVVLTMELGMRAVPSMGSPLVTTLALRLLQLTAMGLLLRGLFTQGGLGSLKFTALKQALTRGAIWAMAFGGVVGLVALLLIPMGINPLALVQMRLPQDAPTLTLFFLTGGLIAPMAEELFFRGILYGLLRPMGVLPAVLISTLFFAFAHAAPGMLPVTQLAGGLLFAAAYEKEGHIAVPIFIHGVGNTALFTLSLI